MNPLRQTCIERAVSATQDCLVVGAGINGAVAAAALSGKGAKVTVIDKGDFASCTSQESSNLAWGGIKYLENYEFKLVWDLCKSRNHLMKAYPSQVREIRFFTSIAKGFRKPRMVLYFGALLYWFMGRCKTRPPRLLSRKTIEAEAPMVNTAPLAGGIEYSDCYFAENDARFTFGFIRRVLRKKNNAVNYMELIDAEFANGLWRAKLKDHISGGEITVNARSLINAAGPYADKLNARLRIESPFKHIFSKGAHIIVPRVTKTQNVLTFFASDGRLFFMIPMGSCTCIGTTDTRVDNETAEPTEDDVAFLLENTNTLLSLEKPLTVENVIAKRCGVRPLVVRKEADVGNAEWTVLSRKHEIDIHPEKNMFTIYGGKLTDCLNVGEEAAEIIQSFGVPLFQTLEKWYGEASANKKARFESEAKKLKLPAEQTAALWTRYGKEAMRCLGKIKADPAAAKPLMADYCRAEIECMAETEMILRLDDFLRRRTRLALTIHPARLHCDPAFKEVSAILFGSAPKKTPPKNTCTQTELRI